MEPVRVPGFAAQEKYRNLFRVSGIVVFGVGLVLAAVGMASFFAAFNSFGSPTYFWMAFIGLPMMSAGGWLLKAGFIGFAARYASGEISPVVKDSASYLTDGEGFHGIGRTADDQPAAAAAGNGPYCRSCGVRNDPDARFCDGCGQSLA